MISKRFTSAVAGADAHALRYQWLRSGKCYRCFHASLRQKAGEDSKAANDEAASVNVPNRGRTRKQRAAKVSEELVMLQRDIPTPSFGRADLNNLRPAGVGKTVDPEAVELNASGGAMGDNDATSREGPYAQGIQVNVRTDVSAAVDSRAARGTGQPVTVESGSERGGSGMEHGIGESSGERLARPTEAKKAKKSSQPKDYSVEAQSPPSRTPAPATPTFNRAIADRLKSIQQPGLSDSERDPTDLARQILRGRFVQFESKEEKAAVLEVAKGMSPLKDGSLLKAPRTAPLPESVRKNMIDTLVAGKYAEDRLLQGEELHTQKLLNDITRATRMNTSYLRPDGDRLLAKVRSLMPASPAPRAQPKALK